MINLDEEVFLKYINQLIDQEIGFITASFSTQKKVYSDLLAYLQTISIDINIGICDKLKTGYKMLEKLLRHINSFEKLLQVLEDMRNSISFENYKISKDIKEYNELAEITINKINSETFKIQTFIQSSPVTYTITPVRVDTLSNLVPTISDMENLAACSDDEFIEAENVLEAEPVLSPKFSHVKTPACISLKNCKFTPNTLVISELTKTVKLPYTIKELKKILRNKSNKFVSLREIIKALYTKPLSDYKNSSYARFKEGYNLMRVKEKSSISEAFGLGLELFSNYNLHPAIIAACKDLNQLDVYLSCLEYNELQDFPFFKIVFNAVPAVPTKAVLKKTLAKRKKMARHLAEM